MGMATDTPAHRIAPPILAPPVLPPSVLTALIVPLMAAMLLWPAVWNGYPIVFADTGTYLSQAIHGYLGWDRPPFYSLFMVPLHLTLTTWPVIVAQALAASWVLSLVWRILAPDRPVWWLLPGTALLAVGTWLPWLTSELMPDLFTPLVVLTFCLLTAAPDRLMRAERAVLVPLAAFMIAAQQSSVALWIGLLVAAAVWWGVRPVQGRGWPDRWTRAVSLMLPPLLAGMALCAVNFVGHGRLALSPFGNVFLLARLVADGPARATLVARCPAAGWRLCPFVTDLPTDSDVFLWSDDSAISRAGGHKAVSAEASTIIAETLRAEPAWVLGTAVRNALAQLVCLRSGDGLEPWPTQVTPWIARDFPVREHAAYAAARQANGALSVPFGLGTVHVVVALGGIGACLALLPGTLRRSRPHAGFLAIVLLALPLGAAITGALSAPHDRYQARIAWLPAFVVVVTVLGLPRSAPQWRVP